MDGRDLARFRMLHLKADDREHDNEHEHGEKQVHENARQKDDRTLPEGQRAVLLAVLGLVKRMGVGHFASLAQLVGGGRRQPRRGRLLQSALAGRNARGAVGVVLIGLGRSDDAAPFHQLFQGIVGFVVADAAIAGHVFHVGGAAAVKRRERLLQVRLQRAGLHAAHLRVAAEGHGRDAIAGLALREADGGAGQAQHELGHAHAEGPSGQVVAALVDEHKEADADNGADDHDEDVHRCLLIYERFPASRGRNGCRWSL